MCKKLSLKYDYGYKLCIAINDMSWIYRNLYENELQEEYYNIGKQQYRQAYYLALARKDNILAEKLKMDIRGFISLILRLFRLFHLYQHHFRYELDREYLHIFLKKMITRY